VSTFDRVLVVIYVAGGLALLYFVAAALMKQG
jgi:hypothetical protein